ncbi:copper homeostasis protein CutC [Porphyromonas circumdentaria]|uniref:PF03932 family protein CutC n=1 Tax=Porphyromonas circumdentaria TaxID=29524 RepID=A0A1T4NY85_9PORP|nr:copper homeostasis protein CutC [Porphyromonas circumdentaria]MBB6276234.1 copper homeostasis protein [Porphyromonas circumdentaria]MDO4722293.1 copper homeostasis protein CutC [Porphyromonas circumdentaria]SJZ84213.1 copper homeostasis protein [Porphyromonas circumdentaria]
MRYELEVCVPSAEGAMVAQKGGACRVELCAALAIGGITPSMACIERACELTDLDVYVLVRPREGHFVYAKVEVEEMCRDIKMARKLGVDGFVFGALTLQGAYDYEANSRLLEAADGLPCTFHRAFDVARQPNELLEVLIEQGFRRVLTSGCAASVVEGLPLLRELTVQAAGRIGVQCGGGVTPENIESLARFTGARMFHGSFRSTVPSPLLFDRKEIDMGANPDGSLYVTSLEKVSKASHILSNFFS